MLRRYRSGQDGTAETAVARYAAEHGYRVPKVYAARSPDLILQRLAGPTMGAVLNSIVHPLGAEAGRLPDLSRGCTRRPAAKAGRRRGLAPAAPYVVRG